MKIVVLDGGTLNPGDLDWQGLHALGQCAVYDRTPDELVIERAKDAEVILTNKVVLDRPVLDQLPKLKFVSVLATGYNIVDTDAAREKGIDVANVPTYGTDSVAQMTFAHILNLAQHVAHHSDTVRAGRWSKSDDWCYWDYPMVELAGLTLGLVGIGRIGQAAAALGLAFGMRVIAFDAYMPKSPMEGVDLVDLETLFKESDVLSCHCPLTPETENLVNSKRLKTMKKTAWVVNTSRGPVINNVDLAEALNAGTIAGAGLDVLDVEPPPLDNPLLTAKNAYVTPHISWATRSARARLMQTSVDNVKSFMGGAPQNVVN